MKKTILIAPLNWGLGHVTRCIPIISALLENNFNPIIASDGQALLLLKKEFPDLLALELPSYQIEYPKNGKNLKWKLFKNSLKTVRAVRQEKKIIAEWIPEYNINGIISDNRLGIYSYKVPSVYITHQLKVMSGNTTWITSKIHQQFIKKYTECWIPDFESEPNLSGKLGHLAKTSLKIKYIGSLSRLNKKDIQIKYDLMIVLSGLEPQRGLFEAKLKKEVLKYEGKTVFIKGVIEENQIKKQEGNVTYYNFMTSKELEKTFNSSELILCRAGYTTIMDLAQLQKKAFFVPTPGQFEQEYLAKYLLQENLIPFATQDNFKIELLLEIDNYKGLPRKASQLNWGKLFQVFE
ncbi:glycosyltransferase family protein [Flavobacterium sp. PL11]|uniref:glycosyltransferase family protein n=1 Tax=Flavobacterium sp. PL11 TaxID=3071717 RepID=UPI002E14B2F9